MKLSIVMPAFNEAATVYEALRRVHEVQLVGSVEKEVVVVNDGSSDHTEAEVRRFTSDHPSCLLLYRCHARNSGKGAALRTGFSCATGDLVVVQDADLEYDPEEINLLLQPVLRGQADVVYGSRFVGGRPHRILFFWHSVGNKLLTTLCNACTDLNLTDMETCYKLFRTDLLRSLKLRENGFGFEPEVTAKVARTPGVKLYEVGISYYGRTYQEGKKITWRDGLYALFCILRYGLFSDRGPAPPSTPLA